MRILAFLLLLGCGLLFLVRTDDVVGFTGRVGWAERNIGGAGTYTLYKLIGVALILIGFAYVTGVFDRTLGGLVRGFVGGLQPQ